MKFFFTSLTLILVIAFAQKVPVHPTLSPAQVEMPSGRWRVKFTLSGTGEKNLIFDCQAKGSGSFMLLDTAPDNKPVPASIPALWFQTTNSRVSFSGDVELPYGTCCREMGTLIFKGKINSDNSISGKALFVGSTEEEENGIGFRSMTGTFTAVPVR